MTKFQRVIAHAEMCSTEAASTSVSNTSYWSTLLRNVRSKVKQHTHTVTHHCNNKQATISPKCVVLHDIVHMYHSKWAPTVEWGVTLLLTTQLQVQDLRTNARRNNLCLFDMWWEYISYTLPATQVARHHFLWIGLYKKWLHCQCARLPKAQLLSFHSFLGHCCSLLFRLCWLNSLGCYFTG